SSLTSGSIIPFFMQQSLIAPLTDIAAAKFTRLLLLGGAENEDVEDRMPNRLAVGLSGALVAALLKTSALAQGRAEGAIVIRDNAPIYLKSSGSAIVDTRMRGDYVVGVTTMFTVSSFQFEDEDGRLHLSYFRDKDQKGMMRTGWMDPADLARFTYECGCGSRKKPCSPFSSQGFILRWNTCYLEGKDRKVADLKSKPEASSAETREAARGASQVKPGEKPLTNDDIVAMHKAGLGDDIVIAKIQQTTGNFDTSADALIRLKKAGISKPVMNALLKPATSPDSTKTEETPTSGGGTAPSPGVSVNGKKLLLNGSGLRRRMGVVVYAGDLYLEALTQDASVVVGEDQTRRLVLRVLLEKITKDQLASSFNKGFKENSPAAAGALKDSFQRFVSWLETVSAGDEIVITYVPGSGTALSIGPEMKGTIEGKDFADALFSIWFGPEPVDDDLKKGMLGQG
ncbi:MAG: chalcone isomerase family protein, partial [Thermoanaerobaculia bacterium]